MAHGHPDALCRIAAERDRDNRDRDVVSTEPRDGVAELVDSATAIAQAVVIIDVVEGGADLARFGTSQVETGRIDQGCARISSR